MQLNQNSLSARLYKEFYSCENLPTNLCPYFWKLVVAYVVSPIYFIVVYPIKRKWMLGKIFSGILFAFAVAIALTVIGFLLYINYHLIRAAIGCYYYKSWLANSAIFWDTYIFVVLPGIIKYFKGEKSPKEKVKREYLVTEFIKAKYNRYCPQITWKEKEA